MIWINLLRSLGRHASPVTQIGWQSLRKAALPFASWPGGNFRAGLEQVSRLGLPARLSAGQSNAREILGVIEILPRPAVEGALHSGANPARQVDIGRRNDDRFVLVFDADNAVERVLSFFGVLLMSRQANNLVHLPSSKNAVLFKHTGREIVVDAPTCCTRLIAAFGRGRPPPASLMIDGTPHCGQKVPSRSLSRCW
jgi:hypothetical protein